MNISVVNTIHKSFKSPWKPVRFFPSSFDCLVQRMFLKAYAYRPSSGRRYSTVILNTSHRCNPLSINYRRQPHSLKPFKNFFLSYNDLAMHRSIWPFSRRTLNIFLKLIWPIIMINRVCLSIISQRTVRGHSSFKFCNRLKPFWKPWLNSTGKNRKSISCRGILHIRIITIITTILIVLTICRLQHWHRRHHVHHRWPSHRSVEVVRPRNIIYNHCLHRPHNRVKSNTRFAHLYDAWECWRSRSTRLTIDRHRSLNLGLDVSWLHSEAFVSTRRPLHISVFGLK